MKACTNPEIGRLIAHYELDALEDAERDAFEMHLMDCRFCRQELQQFRAVSDTMTAHKAEILEALEREGASVQRHSRSAARGVTLFPRNGLEKILALLRRPLVWTPAAAAMAAIGLFLVLGRNPQVSDGYQPLLSFRALPYESITFRDWPTQRAERLFDEGMKFYVAQAYDSAAILIEQAVQLQPQMGPWWLYLGVCRYLQRDPVPAIEALQKADSLNSMIFSVRTRWYLAQSYLLNGDTTRAMPLLEWIVEQDLGYRQEAAELMEDVRKR
ncbi:MAG: hypothetical protein PHI18_01615 [bacterium]|nr:hypothetical protein [bacterium]